MKPGFERLLSSAADAIGSQLAPHLRGDAAASGQASMIRLIVMAAAQQADREPDTLMSEIAAMRRLFEAASDTLLPGDLCERLRAAADESEPHAFTVSALTDLSNQLKAVLIELHIELEEISAPWARALEAQVWDILRMGADRRQLKLKGLT